jgi:hypothetical protein
MCPYVESGCGRIVCDSASGDESCDCGLKIWEKRIIKGKTQ